LGKFKNKSKFEIMNKYFIFTSLLSIILSCGPSGDSENESTNNSAPIQTEKLSKDKTKALSTEYLGTYYGIQQGYFMKNQYGDDMLINGNKVPVPSIDFKFLLKEDNIVNLQQINLEDNSRVYYKGSYKIILDDSNVIKIECSLSNIQVSNPSYVLTINRSDKKGICTGSNEPEFSIEKK